MNHSSKGEIHIFLSIWRPSPHVLDSEFWLTSGSFSGGSNDLETMILVEVNIKITEKYS